jgi:hypothetical protein
MYRQLLHASADPDSNCRGVPKLRRQKKAVKHILPGGRKGWKNRMVISYDNLIRRLWLDGAMPVHLHYDDTAATGDTSTRVPISPCWMPTACHLFRIRTGSIGWDFNSPIQ